MSAIYNLRTHWARGGWPACQNDQAKQLSDDLFEVTCSSCLRVREARRQAGLEGLSGSVAASIISHRRRVRITPRGGQLIVWAGKHLIYRGTREKVDDYIKKYNLEVIQ